MEERLKHKIYGKGSVPIETSVKLKKEACGIDRPDNLGGK